ncbi:SWIM zinc finger family protein [Sporolactobacillus vineae]|uniref:SWIM zinc finger family protein n=1 Tax=Sporolactobacillus vineae TaxID=444463 RepID=UPI000288BFAE|nr:SWIM zinc finger family protein [Sporolactobacillus vineae]
MAPIRIRHPELSDWLIRFSQSVSRPTFERAVFLCRNNRVWDYHFSAAAVHASVEDMQNIFFDAEVSWRAAGDPANAALHLPDPSADLNCSCSCGGRMPCAHVCAVVIYRILELDNKWHTDRKTQPAAVPDQDDVLFGILLDKLRQMAGNAPPAVARFNPAALNTRPDLQQKAAAHAERVIRAVHAADKNQNNKH